MSDEMPGQRTIDAGSTPREILMSGEGVIHISGPVVIDSANAYDGGNTSRVDELRAGWLMAQVTATKKWVPCKRTAVTNTGTLTALVVDNAAAFKVGDVISVGADTAITITAINYTTNTMTIASTAVVAGEAVVCTSLAGSETARGLLKESVRTQSGVPYETTAVDKAACIITAGYINEDYVLGDLAACRADTAARLSGFLWADRQQGN